MDPLNTIYPVQLMTICHPHSPFWATNFTNDSFTLPFPPHKSTSATTIIARYEHNLHQLLPFVPCDASGQAIEQRRGYTNAAVDLYQILPSTAIRCTLNRDAVLHLRCYRDAGMCFVSKSCDAATAQLIIIRVCATTEALLLLLWPRDDWVGIGPWWGGGEKRREDVSRMDGRKG